MPPKGKPQPSISELMEGAARKLKASVASPSIVMYKPHAKQEFFHRSIDYGRLYVGGNRSGKTFSAVVEDIWWCTGTHPFRETPPVPVRGRVVAVDLKKGVEQILLPLFKQLCTPSMLIDGSWEASYSVSSNLLTFANGSTIEFMSYEQDTEKFAGTSRHFIHYDEEPPKNVFDECQMRILDTEGSFWISMTPVEGITWLYDEIYLPVTEGAASVTVFPGNERVGSIISNPELEMTVIHVDNGENPHLSDKGRDRAMRTLSSEEERRARQSGKFVEMGGVIFKGFSEATHVVEPFIPPITWEWYMSIDSGWNNPTAVLWHAVAPNGDIYTFSEHYQKEMTVEAHAATIKLREGVWGYSPPIRTGDPAMKQTREATGTSVQEEYAKHGIYLALDSVPRDVATGMAIMQQYFKVNPATNKPRWFITEDCPNFISEMKRLRWKKYGSSKTRYENNKREEVQKKDDHTFDSARYFATFLPVLNIESEKDNFPHEEPKRPNMSYVEALLKSIDDSNTFAGENSSDNFDKQTWEHVSGVDLQDMYR